MKLRTTFLWTLIISLSLAAVLGICAIVLPDLIGRDTEILVTAVLLGAYSLPPLACSIVMSRRQIRWAMWIGIVCSPLAWAMWLPLIWGNPWTWRADIQWEEFLIKTALTLTFVSVWATHLGLLLLLRLDRPWFQLARTVTVTFATLILLLVVPAIWLEYDGEPFFRILAVVGIMVGSGTIMTPVFALLDTIGRRTGRESVDDDLRVQIICPRCGSTESLGMGPTRCASCELRIEMKVEEPRCACGYLLYRLTGDRCPECGRTARCACGCLVDDPNGKCPKCGQNINADQA